MRLEIWRDGDAWARLGAPAFREQWERLYAGCPWASVFQSYGYASTWYHVYRPRYAPLIIGAVADDNTLVGLLPLAMSKDGQPIVAGGRHAEYHVWMARAAEGDAFIEAALDRVAAECPGRTLTFRYLPPNAPRTWLGSSRGIAGRCVLIPARRGVMDLTEASTEAALRKKGHRERLRHLERFGPVVYERVTDPQQIDALLDAIIPLCDLRHGALHDVMPFADDPLKAPFHRALARVPGVLYVSVLRCGDQIACAGFDADNRGQVALGFAAFSPRLSRYSPRRAQITTLARDLSLQGYTSIDLTPGADEFKSERATRYDEAYTLHVYFGRSRFALRRAGDAARRTARAMLKRAGADPARLRERLGTWSDAVIGTSRAPALAGLALRRRGWGDDVVDLYRFESDAIDALPAGGAMHRDRFADFAAYRPGVLTPKPRSVFLRAALKRLEHGAHVFTRVDGGELVACGWISGAPVSEGCTEAGHGLHRPPDSALVDDLAAIPRLATSGELVSMLGQIVREAAGLPGVEYVLVAAPSSQPEVRRAALRLGGRHAATLVKGGDGLPMELPSPAPTTDTYSLPQSQDESDFLRPTPTTRHPDSPPLRVAPVLDLPHDATPAL